MVAYRDLYQRSLADPESFWLEAAQRIAWITPPTRALDSSRPPFYRWFPDGELNVCYNALDRHVLAGRGDQPALIWDSPVTDTKTSLTYSELTDQVAQSAAVLKSLGVRRADTVVIYMPMIPEAVVAMLACARLGAVHSVVFGGFAPAELAARIDDATPTVVVTASCGIEAKRVIAYKPMLDLALAQAKHQPDHCLILQRPQLAADETGRAGRDVDWAVAMNDPTLTPAPCEPMAATDPLYILYTSGTTGKPKGVVRDSGGYAVALAWSMPNIYDTHPGEVMWTASDIGWVVGHSYIVYAPLLVGCTTVVYEGKPVGTPDAGAFWRVASEHRVKTLFSAPTAMRAIRKEDPKANLVNDYDLSALESVYLAGERLDPDTYHWTLDALDRPVVDHWWQTETGWGIVANLRGVEALPFKPGSPSVPVPGFDVAVLDAEGHQADRGAEGSIAIRLPLPPGCLSTLWHDDARFVSSYLERFEGWYNTGDGGIIDEDGYVFVMGRNDDVINVAGHRLSSGALEEVLITHPAVAECAVIGVVDEIKGHVPVGLVVLSAGASVDPQQIERQLIDLVRNEIGPIAAPRQVLVVAALPKTRSGKVLRATMRAMADGRPVVVPPTIDDPTVLDALRPVLYSGPVDN